MLTFVNLTATEQEILCETFEQAFREMYSAVKDLLENAEDKLVDTSFYIQEEGEKPPIYFPAARSRAVDSGLMDNILLEEEAEQEANMPKEDMDGDHQTALASAGFGTDEDYEHNPID